MENKHRLPSRKREFTEETRFASRKTAISSQSKKIQKVDTRKSSSKALTTGSFREPLVPPSLPYPCTGTPAARSTPPQPRLLLLPFGRQNSHSSRLGGHESWRGGRVGEWCWGPFYLTASILSFTHKYFNVCCL